MSEVDLPDGWVWTRLDQVCSKIQDGTHFSPKEQTQSGDFKYITAKNIKERGIDLANVTYISEKLHRPIFQRCNPERGDVLYIKDGATTGIATINNLDEEFSLLSSVALLKPLRNTLDPHYLKWHLNGPVGFKYMTDQMTGSAITRLTLDLIRNSTIPLPPLAEQKRIVAKVEALMARVNAARQRLAKVPALLKRFRQSVLAAACSGRLTEDWRKGSEGQQSPEIPSAWQDVHFRDLISSIRSGSTAVPQNDATANAVLRSSSVRPRFVDLEDVRYLTREQSENEANFLVEGDLLFTRLSGSVEYVANCAMVRGLNKRRVQYPDRLFCVKLKDARLAPYVEFCFGDPILRKGIEEKAKSSAGHQRVSMGDITNQVLRLPPLSEQDEIVRRVSSLLSRADGIENRLASATRRVETLTQAILAQAFRGELVLTEAELARREGRDYEPASILLERIRATVNDGQQAPRKRSTGKSVQSRKEKE